jgi:hypothetical protein
VSSTLLPSISQHPTQVLLRHSFFKEASVQLAAKLYVVFSEKPLQEVYSGSCFAERALALFSILAHLKYPSLKLFAKIMQNVGI